MIRLGLRLAFAGGRGAVTGLALTATAVAVGTAILLYALSFAPALAERDARTAWRDSFTQAPETGDRATLVLQIMDRAGGRPLLRFLVAADGVQAGPTPADIAALPAAGKAIVSPALETLMRSLPADRLADRIGSVVGTIDPASLASPDELVAIVGTNPEILRGQGAMRVSAFGTEPAPLDLPPIGALIVVLAAVGALAPVAVFVSTATRMSAARRELRLAALRLVGATPRQVARLAVVEALAATSLGALAGIALFAVGRPLIAQIPLDGTTWWPDSIMPPIRTALVMLLAVQVVGAASALLAMRRLTISPLGVQRRSTPSQPSAWRVLPVAVAVPSLLAAIALYRGQELGEQLALSLAGLAFAGIIGSIALAGPWVTGLLGRMLHRYARGASGLLAARRLGDEPRGSFGAIAGVIMAVFVASAFFTFAAYTRSQTGAIGDPLLQPNAVVAYMGGGSGTASLPTSIGRLDGVTGVVAVREVALVRNEVIEDFGWVAACPELQRALGLQGAACAASGINTSGGARFSGEYVLVPDRSDQTGARPPSTTVSIAPGSGEPFLSVEGEVGGHLPPVLIDPVALDDPASIGGFPVTRIYVTTDGSPGVVERVQTAVAAVQPASFFRSQLEPLAENTQFEEIGRIVALGLVGTLALAGCSLAVAVTTATLERRRQFVFLRSAGMPASSLRWTILLQAGVPLAGVAAVSAALGIIVGVGALWVATDSVTTPDASVIGILVLSLAVAMGIVALTLPPLERMTRPASLRSE